MSSDPTAGPTAFPAEPTARTDRFRGCLLGLTAGDAVGTTVKFSPRGSVEPLTGNLAPNR